MHLTAPTILTLFRIALVPVLVLFFYLPYGWANLATVVVFVLAAVTDWADGFIARRFDLASPFGAFLDPVADKLMVATALVLLVQQQPEVLFALAAAIIIGREIVISALREWMAEMGERGRVKVSSIGKLKTIFQMVAISFLLYGEPLLGIPIEFIGEWLLYLAAALTLWSMWVYLHSAWPTMAGSSKGGTAMPDSTASDAVGEPGGQSVTRESGATAVGTGDLGAGPEATAPSSAPETVARTGTDDR